MMRTIFVLLFCSSFLSAQNIFKNYVRPEYSINIQNTDSLKNGRYLNVIFDGKKKLFLFDTGAPKSLVFENSNEQKDAISKTSTKSAVGKKVELKIIKADEFSSSIVNTKYKTLFSVPNDLENYTCAEKVMDGILGMDFYYESNKPILLDYQLNTIKLLDEFSPKEHSDYYEADVKFKGLLLKLIYIQIYVNGKKEKFLFDTGATDGSLYMQTPKQPRNADAVFEQMFLTASGIKPTEMKVVKENIVSVGKFEGIKTDVVYSDEIPNNILGLSFIKNFNWILDKKRGKMYFKPIGKNQFYSPMIDKKAIYVAANKNKLIVASVKKSENPKNYKVGDEIVSVNNQLVTSQNICEMQNLINKTADLELLNIKINN